MRLREKQCFATGRSESQKQSLLFSPGPHQGQVLLYFRRKWCVSLQHSSLTLTVSLLPGAPDYSMYSENSFFYSFQVFLQRFKNSSEHFNKYATAFKRDNPIF